MEFPIYLCIYLPIYKIDSTEFNDNRAQANTSLTGGLILITSTSNTFVYCSCNIFVVIAIVLNLYDKTLSIKYKMCIICQRYASIVLPYFAAVKF